MLTSQQIGKRIETLCENKYGKRKIKDMLIGIGLNTSFVDNLKKGSMPSIDKICKIADFFNCTVDYIIGRSDIVAAPVPDILSPEERHLIEQYRLLSPLERANIDGRVEALVEVHETA